MPIAYEYNFDGLIGPTHNYAGLSRGNLASIAHQGAVSYPKQAALQGLAKMKLLAELGVKQALLPPQERPHLALLRSHGLSGSDEAIIEAAASQSPHRLAASYSASSMWAANAATVSPSSDTQDHRVHFTPANLFTQQHRSIEASATHRLLSRLFADESHFVVHPPLEATERLRDEGAANHTRLSAAPTAGGLNLFTFGSDERDPSLSGPVLYPARQSREASQVIAREHQLSASNTFFMQQNPAAIDAGVFHNDVIAVGHGDLFLYHEQAYVDQGRCLREVADRFAAQCGKLLSMVEVREDEVPLADAVSSYLFNSQIVSLPDGTMSIICPIECMEHESTRRFLDDLLQRDTPIRSRHVVDLRQSMNNGGGPACLRLRIVLTEAEAKAMHQGVIWSPALNEQLIAWVNKHYREELKPDDLRDPKLITEGREALDELTGILGLPGLYGFQH